MDKIDFSSLEKALKQLQESLGYASSNLARNDEGIFRQFRMAAVQAFEYTYELSYKMLKRKLEEISESAESVDQLGFRDLLRLGAEKGFVQDPLPWFTCRELRNITSHIYDEQKAEKVFGKLPDFLRDATFLLARLQHS